MYSLIAVGGGGGAGGSQDFITGVLIPFGLVFLIMYFLMIRPQQKKQQEHENFLRGLKTGDRVITQGGMMGKITSVSDNIITLEIADKTRIKLLRSAIASSQGSPSSDGGKADDAKD